MLFISVFSFLPEVQLKTFTFMCRYQTLQNETENLQLLNINSGICRSTFPSMLYRFWIGPHISLLSWWIMVWTVEFVFIKLRRHCSSFLSICKPSSKSDSSFLGSAHGDHDKTCATAKIADKCQELLISWLWLGLWQNCCKMELTVNFPTSKRQIGLYLPGLVS